MGKVRFRPGYQGCDGQLISLKQLLRQHGIWQESL